MALIDYGAVASRFRNSTSSQRVVSSNLYQHTYVQQQSALKYDL